MLRTLCAVFFISVAALFSGACSDQAGDPSPRTGEEMPPVTEAAEPLRIGWVGAPDTLNPGMATSFNAFTLFDLVYESLYQLQLDGAIIPELVTNASVSEDQRVWTFTIRADAAWHDGEPLTADDVAYSLQLYMETAAFPVLHPATTFFESVAVSGEYTVVLTLAEPIPNLQSRLLYLYVLPRHLWADLQGEALLRFVNPEMIGSGPFKVIDYRPGEAVHLAANANYHGTTPAIDEVVFQTFAAPEAMVQALISGELDMITEAPPESVATLNAAGAEIAVVAGQPALSVPIGPPYVPAVHTIFFNQKSSEGCPPASGQCTGHPALRDRTVRLAMAHAVDKQALVAGVLDGLGVPGLSLIPSSLNFWFNESLVDHAYDPALANRLLEEAGYVDTDGNGIREMPNGGEALIFRLNWSSDSDWAAPAAELLGQMWREIGIVVVPKALEPQALQAICCPTYDYDIILWAWSSDPDPHFLLSLLTSERIANGLNETGYTNPVYDALFARQATTLDPTARQEIVREMQRLIHDDVVYLIPFYRYGLQAYRTDRFQGWITGTPMLDLAHVSSLLQVELVE